jgi:hypothetical protein
VNFSDEYWFFLFKSMAWVTVGMLVIAVTAVLFGAVPSYVPVLVVVMGSVVCGLLSVVDKFLES